MSKSRGNLVFVSELAKRADPAAIRLALMGRHYRADWEWNDDDLNDGAELLDTLCEAVARGSTPGDRAGADVGEGVRAALRDRDGMTAPLRSRDGDVDPAPFAQRLRDALDDDLDAPRARAVLAEFAAAVLAAGDRAGSAPSVLAELCELCGVSVPRPQHA